MCRGVVREVGGEGDGWRVQDWQFRSVSPAADPKEQEYCFLSASPTVDLDLEYCAIRAQPGVTPGACFYIRNGQFGVYSTDTQSSSALLD